MILALDLENEYEFIRLKMGRRSSKQKEQCEQNCESVSLGSLTWRGRRFRREPGYNEKSRDIGKTHVPEDPGDSVEDLNFILQEHQQLFFFS